MTSLKKTLLTTAAILVVPVAAAAQDWAGWYGGFTLGYGFGDAEHTFSNLAPTGDSSPDGVLLGGFVGYGWQSGNLVWGAEIDAEFSDVSGSFVSTAGATSQGVAELNWQGSIRGVIGHAGALGSKPALYYFTAGWATGDYDFLGGPSVPVPPGGGYSERLDGWTAGVGMDVQVSPDATVRVEYRYSDLGSASGVLAPTFPAVTMPVDVKQHVLRVGVRLSF